MKKILVSLCFVFGFTTYAMYQKNIDTTLSYKANSTASVDTSQNSVAIEATDTSQLDQQKKQADVIVAVIPTKRTSEDEGDDNEYDDEVAIAQPIKTVVKPVVVKTPVKVVPKPSTTVVVTQTPAPVVTPTPVIAQGKYKNGIYTGSKADASYGIIQVKATITNGKISDVVFLSYPNNKQHSVQVSNYAMPILKQEAISTQSAQVDAVSGASYTSAAFVESLSAALSQAS